MLTLSLNVARVFVLAQQKTIRASVRLVYLAIFDHTLLMQVEYNGKGPAWLTLGRGVCFTWYNEGRELKQRLSADHQCGKERGGDVVKLLRCAFPSKNEEKQARDESVEMISPQPSYSLHPFLLDGDKSFQ